MFTSSSGSALGFGLDFIYYGSKNIGITADMDLLGGTIKEYDSTFGDITKHIILDEEDFNNVRHILLGAGQVLKI